MIVKNKDVIQSYIMTTAKYDFSKYEKNILYKIVEMHQQLLDGKTLSGRDSIQEGLFGDRYYTIPISDILNGEEDKNYKRAKQALISLEGKKMIYNQGGDFEVIRLIQNPKIEKGSSYVRFMLTERVHEAMFDFTKGYRKYELKTAMSFKSIYSMRIYEIVSGQDRPITYPIEYLKGVFCVDGKYKLNADFFRFVIDVAKKELDKKSPYTFDYQKVKTGRKVTSITFIPKYQPQHRDQELEGKEIAKRASYHWEFPVGSPEEHYLINQFGFDAKGIKNNMDLFRACKAKGLSLVDEFAEIFPKASKADNPQGYLIRTLQKKIGWKKK